MLIPLWVLLALAFLAGAAFGGFVVIVLMVARARVRAEVAGDLVGLLKLVQPAAPDVVKE